MHKLISLKDVLTKKLIFFFIILLLFSSEILAKSINCDEFLKNLNFTDPPYNKIENDQLILNAPADFNLHNFSDLDLKENKYTADISLKFWYLDSRLNYLAEQYSFDSNFYCEYEYSKIEGKYVIPEVYFNTTEILKITKNIVSFSFIQDQFYVTRLIDNVAVHRSTIPFNFKKFPFDTQFIDLRMDTVPMSYWLNDDFYEVKLKLNLDNNSEDPSLWVNSTTFGWSITDYIIKYSETEESLSAIMTLQRDYFYFILKVIFPILLIVFISWSVFLIHPRAIEAKVNVTIVCLLALIAYNFVIEDNLPKVSYITIMDVFILMSYLFSALTTIFAIYSYRVFIVTDGDKIALSSMDKFVRNISLFVFLIVVIGISLYIYYA